MKKHLLRETKVGGVLLIVLLGFVWEALVSLQLVTAVSLPPPSAILQAWWHLAVSGELLSQLAYSLKRMCFGYLIAIFFGVGLGLLMGYFRVAYNLLEPLTEILRPIPSAAYIPAVILFLGIDDEMKVFIIALACFFPMLLNTYSGVQAVDPVQVNTGRTFGLNSRRIVWKIIIPAASPYIVTGLRIGLGVALILMVISEMIASNNGIGFFILSTERSFRVREMYAGIITLGLVGYVLNYSFLQVERTFMAWHIGFTQKEA